MGLLEKENRIHPYKRICTRARARECVQRKGIPFRRLY
ncbi:MAG: hypothetical protein IKF99_21000 [Oscillospiraceae bacterium]|nr:hypothetical protein [Oscillospiraceae bacterium]